MKSLYLLILSVISSILSAQVTITSAFAIPGFGISKLVTDAQGMIYVLQGKLYAPLQTEKQKLVIRKYTPNGLLVWERTMTGNGLYIIDAAMRSDQLIFAGSFSDTLQYDGQQIMSKGQLDIYLARISSDGSMDIRRQGGSGNEQITAFAVDDNQNPFFAGIWRGQVNFVGYNEMLENPQHFIACTDPSMSQANWMRTGFSLLQNPNILIRELRILDQQIYGRIYNGKILLYPSDTIGKSYSGLEGFVMSLGGKLLKARTGEWTYYRGGGHFLEDVGPNGNSYWRDGGSMCSSDGLSCTSGSSVLWRYYPTGWASFVVQSNQIHVVAGRYNCYGYHDSTIQVGTIGPVTSSVASLTGTFGISSPYCGMRLSPYRLGETIMYGHFSKRLHLPGFDLTADTDVPFVAIINWDGTVDSEEIEMSGPKIYPNPTRGNLLIDSKVSGPLEMYDIRGERIYQTTIISGKNNLDISHLPAGLYLAQFDDGHSRVSKRIVRE